MKKIDENTRNLILGLLALNYSYSMILKTLKQRNIIVSKGYISKINKNKENFNENCKENRRRSGRPPALSRQSLLSIEKAIKVGNPPTYTSLAQKYKVSRWTISRYDKKYLCF